MRSIGYLFGLAVVLALPVALYLVAIPGGDPDSTTPLLVFTQVPASSEVAAPDARKGAFPEGSRIVAVPLDSPADSRSVLTDGFVSARAPYPSFDGRYLLFSAKRTDTARWQIWELALADGSVKQLTEWRGDCTDPFYLPDGRIGFSARSSNSGRFVLYTETRAGGRYREIIFHPRSDRRATILPDGRVLFASRTPGREEAPRELFAARYDGTQAELFYRADSTGRITARAWTGTDGRVYFVEDESPASTGGRVATVSLERPLHSRIDLLPERDGRTHSVYPLDSDRTLLSYRPTGRKTFGLYVVRADSSGLRSVRSGVDRHHALEPVVVRKRPRPARFLSVVDTTKEVGWLYGIDARRSDRPVSGSGTPPASRLKVFTRTGTLGTVPLKEGSFYLEVPADTPVRFVTLDGEGRRIRGPSAWIWVRPNENRGCIGCHEGREFAPPNQVPPALRSSPVMLPVSPVRAGSQRPIAATP